MIVDYSKMEAPELFEACGDDAKKWAQAFIQCTKNAVIDEGLMIGWFANAIEHSCDVREKKACSTGVELIAAERKRQIEKGWTAEHDDKAHNTGSLAKAAICYALEPDERKSKDDRPYSSWFLDFWPWEYDGWKPTPDNRIRELEKAGALIAAEIDRLIRLKKSQ